MKNAKKNLSLAMIAIFTTFIVLSGIPASAVTKAATAKKGIVTATYYVVKSEKATNLSVKVAQNQLAVAVKYVAKVKTYGKSYARTYKKLNARLNVVKAKIGAKIAITQLIKATSCVIKIETLVKKAPFNVTTAKNQYNVAIKEIKAVKTLGSKYNKTYLNFRLRDMKYS